MATRKFGDRIFMVVPTLNFTVGVGRIPVSVLLKTAVSDIQEALYDVAQRLVPRDTGELASNGIGKEGPVRIAPGVYHAGIGLKKSPHYGIFVHDGTGIYGPRKSPIVPRTAPYLKFTIGERTFRLKSVKGQEAQPFIDQAYEIVNRTYVPMRVNRLRRAIQTFANN